MKKHTPMTRAERAALRKRLGFKRGAKVPAHLALIPRLLDDLDQFDDDIEAMGVVERITITQPPPVNPARAIADLAKRAGREVDDESIEAVAAELDDNEHPDMPDSTDGAVTFRRRRRAIPELEEVVIDGEVGVGLKRDDLTPPMTSAPKTKKPAKRPPGVPRRRGPKK